MMRFAAVFLDRPGTADLRAANLDAHRAFLARHKAAIVLAGPLRDDADGPARGGLWIIEAADKAAAMAIVHEDPFFTAGLRASIELYHWGADGRIG